MGDSTEGCIAGPPPPGQPGAGTPNVGGCRKVPALPVLPPTDGPQSTAFNDEGWRAVEVPHDFVVEQVPNPLGKANHGFRSWVRPINTACHAAPATAGWAGVTGAILGGGAPPRDGEYTHLVWSDMTRSHRSEIVFTQRSRDSGSVYFFFLTTVGVANINKKVKNWSC